MTPEPIADQPKGMGEVARFAGVFFEPGKTFEDIGRRPTFILPLVLGILVGLIFVNLVGQRIGWDRVVRQQVESSSRAAQIAPEVREQQIQAGSKFAPIFGYVAVIGSPLFLMLWAA